MQHSEQFEQVATALATAQGAFPVIPRDRTVVVKSRRPREDGSYSSYTFSYAPLSTILEKVRPALAANGLALVQSVVADEKGTEMVRTMVAHSSGQWFANEIPVFTSGADNASQAYASGLTYARRYGVTTLLVLAADEDDDGNGNDDGQRSQRPQASGRKPAQASKPATVSQPKEKADADGEPGEPKPLPEGPTRLLEAKAKAAGMTLAQVAEEFGVVTMASLNDALRWLGERQGSAQ